MSLELPSTSFWLLSHSFCPNSLLMILILAGVTAGLALQGMIESSCPNPRLQSQAHCHSYVKIWKLCYCLCSGSTSASVWRWWPLLAFWLSVGGVLFAWTLIGFAHSWRGPCATLWCSSECIQRGEIEKHLFYPACWRGWRNSLPSTQPAIPSLKAIHIPLLSHRIHTLSLPEMITVNTMIWPAANAQQNFGGFLKSCLQMISHHNLDLIFKDSDDAYTEQLIAVYDWRLPKYMTTPPDPLTWAAETDNSESSNNLGELWW